MILIKIAYPFTSVALQKHRKSRYVRTFQASMANGEKVNLKYPKNYSSSTEPSARKLYYKR